VEKVAHQFFSQLARVLSLLKFHLNGLKGSLILRINAFRFWLARYPKPPVGQTGLSHVYRVTSED
jgi:hypothetical protein